jgi:hypothetical protein
MAVENILIMINLLYSGILSNQKGLYHAAAVTTAIAGIYT